MKKAFVFILVLVMALMVVMPGAYAQAETEVPEGLEGCTVITVDGETYVLEEGDELTLYATETGGFTTFASTNIGSATLRWTFTSSTVTATGAMALSSASSLTSTAIQLRITRSSLSGNWANWYSTGGKTMTLTKSQGLDFGTYQYKLYGTFTAGVGIESKSSETSSVTATRYP